MDKNKLQGLGTISLLNEIVMNFCTINIIIIIASADKIRPRILLNEIHCCAGGFAFIAGGFFEKGKLANL